MCTTSGSFSPASLFPAWMDALTSNVVTRYSTVESRRERSGIADSIPERRFFIDQPDTFCAGSHLRVWTPLPACTCPKTCNTGLMSCNLSSNATHPTCWDPTVSIWPCGGPWVTRMSTWWEIDAHTSRARAGSNFGCGYWKAQFPYSGVNGDPKTVKVLPRIVIWVPECSRKVIPDAAQSISQWSSSSLLQKALSRALSWLPATTILTGWGKEAIQRTAERTSSAVPLWVKSPAWIKTSPAGTIGVALYVSEMQTTQIVEVMEDVGVLLEDDGAMQLVVL